MRAGRRSELIILASKSRGSCLPIMSILRCPVDTFTISNVRRSRGGQRLTRGHTARKCHPAWFQEEDGASAPAGGGWGGEAAPSRVPGVGPPPAEEVATEAGRWEPAPGMASLCHPKRGLSAVPSASSQAKCKVLPLLFCPHSQKVGGTLGSAGVLGPRDSKAEHLPGNSGTEPMGVPCAPHVPATPWGRGH